MPLSTIFQLYRGSQVLLVEDLIMYHRSRRGRDRMVVGFTTTNAISTYHHWCCEFESRSGRGVQHYEIKFVSDLRQNGVFLRVLLFPPPIKLDCHDITEILLKVALNTIKQTNKQVIFVTQSLIYRVMFWWSLFVFLFSFLWLL
jgi:hypothetical protein